MRAYWRDERVDISGEYYTSTAMAMEPKPPQGGDLPIWIGGASEAALRRVGELGDGWLAMAVPNRAVADKCRKKIAAYAEAAGRDPDTIGYQQMLAPPPRDDTGKRFYSDTDRVVARAVEAKEMGFEWGALNATAIFQSGARSVDAILDVLGTLHEAIRTATG